MFYLLIRRWNGTFKGRRTTNLVLIKVTCGRGYTLINNSRHPRERNLIMSMGVEGLDPGLGVVIFKPDHVVRVSDRRR